MNGNSALAADAANPLRDALGVITVICVAVLPDAYNAFVMWMEWVDAPTEFGYVATSLIVRSIQVSSPVLLIVFLTQSGWQSVGIVRVRWLNDILWGLGIWLFGTFAFYATFALLPSSAFPPTDDVSSVEKPTELFGVLVLLAASCANGFAEELVVRGYLLSRIERLFKSTWLAVGITSLLFASYHLYQGVGSMICIGVLGLVYGIAFCVSRRFWPLAVAHAVADFTGWLAS
ncbi:MAG: type II CAAX endopeptidase family protein [Planctomycetota bacterium]|nr:type II CAAX endopeptidase family protein [Planctomycetota bacterium]